MLGVRLNALERPQLLEQIAARGPLQVELLFPRVRALRELRGRDHGRADRCTVTLDPFGAVFVEIGP